MKNAKKYFLKEVKELLNNCEKLSSPLLSKVKKGELTDSCSENPLVCYRLEKSNRHSKTFTYKMQPCVFFPKHSISNRESKLEINIICPPPQLLRSYQERKSGMSQTTCGKNSEGVRVCGCGNWKHTVTCISKIQINLLDLYSCFFSNRFLSLSISFIKALCL